MSLTKDARADNTPKYQLDSSHNIRIREKNMSKGKSEDSSVLCNNNNLNDSMN